MKKPRLSRRAMLRWLFYSSPFLAAGHAFLWEPEWVKVRTRKLTTDKSKHRFVHVSDLHHKGDKAYLEGVVRKINAASPEFVCFTGDIVEETKHLPEALELIGGIKSPVYGVPGNHDYWSGADFSIVEKGFAATGGAWLVEKQASVSQSSILLTGTACNAPLQLQPRAGMKNLLLMHYPAWADKLFGQKYDLLLAGHSHGGQVRLPFLGALLVPDRVGRYELGLYDTKAGPLHVSAGIGWFFLAVRFNCRPEITVFEV
jgi:uncharacterized protein